jgi:hypothetical protein
MYNKSVQNRYTKYFVFQATRKWQNRGYEYTEHGTFSELQSLLDLSFCELQK